MDNVQNCDRYINIPSSQTYRFYLRHKELKLQEGNKTKNETPMFTHVVNMIRLGTRPYRRALGPTQPPVQWVRGSLSTGVKWLKREACHSPPNSAEVKKTLIYASIPLTHTHTMR
jgi:hypothetical protein